MLFNDKRSEGTVYTSFHPPNWHGIILCNFVLGVRILFKVKISYNANFMVRLGSSWSWVRFRVRFRVRLTFRVRIIDFSRRYVSLTVENKYRPKETLMRNALELIKFKFKSSEKLSQPRERFRRRWKGQQKPWNILFIT